MPGIYLKHGDSYVAMTEQAYESEGVLQTLIAQHPEILASDDGGRGALLLVRREASVQQQQDSGLSLDHLYLDARGVPTLVEVKQGANNEVRRKVVAQMLDYAANARRSFGVDRMITWLEEEAQLRGTTADALLAEVLGIEEPDAFWAEVASNLEAEQFRLIFVSDEIPPSLRRIIEFLNGQMTRTEVLAIEVKQYIDTTGTQQTIVPRMVGDTEAAKQTKSTRGGTPPMDRDRLLAMVGDVSTEAAAAVAALLDWSGEHPVLDLWWKGKSGDVGLSGRPPLLRIWRDGQLEVRLQSLRDIDSTWDAARCDQLIRQLEAIDDLRFDQGRKWPKAPIASLADPHKRQRFVAIIDEVTQSLNRSG